MSTDKDRENEMTRSRVRGFRRVSQPKSRSSRSAWKFLVTHTQKCTERATRGPLGRMTSLCAVSIAPSERRRHER